VFVGCQEGLVHRHIYTDRFHGLDGFNMVEFDDKVEDRLDNPIIQKEPAAVAMLKLVNQYPGTLSLSAYAIDMQILYLKFVTLRE